MMLGFLLARAGVDVVVLEKHADFLRDFRGDTVHPSTLELMYELGLLEEFLKLPHQKVERLTAQIGDESVHMADFSHLPTDRNYVALMPQWDFLNFLARQGKHYRTFDLRMQAEATDLIEESGRVIGVRARTPDGVLYADQAGAPPLAQPVDRNAQKLDVIPALQIADTVGEKRRHLHHGITERIESPFLHPFDAALGNDIGALPVVAAIVRFTQRLQLTIQTRIISRVLEGQQRPKPPLLFKLIRIFPVLQRVPARLLGVGIRPEHVRTPDMLAGSNTQSARRAA